MHKLKTKRLWRRPRQLLKQTETKFEASTSRAKYLQRSRGIVRRPRARRTRAKTSLGDEKQTSGVTQSAAARGPGPVFHVQRLTQSSGIRNMTQNYSPAGTHRKASTRRVHNRCIVCVVRAGEKKHEKYVNHLSANCLSPQLKTETPTPKRNAETPLG